MTTPRGPRPITGVDRMLTYGDALDHSVGNPKKSRRRTRFRFGQLEVVVIELTGEPTTVYLANDDTSIVETTAGDLALAADAVRELLANPPPIKRRKR